MGKVEEPTSQGAGFPWREGDNNYANKYTVSISGKCLEEK